MLQICPSSSSCLSKPYISHGIYTPTSNHKAYKRVRNIRVSNSQQAENDDEKKPETKQSLFNSITEALDFAQVRSEEDAILLEDARAATSLGEKMSKEQYNALKRKIGGTYKDFFKGYVEVDGEYIEEGWVDKSCRFCKKDTSNEPRNIDSLGRYAHISCMENSKSGGGIFSWLFGK